MSLVVDGQHDAHVELIGARRRGPRPENSTSRRRCVIGAAGPGPAAPPNRYQPHSNLASRPRSSSSRPDLARCRVGGVPVVRTTTPTLLPPPDAAATGVEPVAPLGPRRRWATRVLWGWVPVLFLWAPMFAWFLALRPGVMNLDSIDVWHQVQTGGLDRLASARADGRQLAVVGRSWALPAWRRCSDSLALAAAMALTS